MILSQEAQFGAKGLLRRLFKLLLSRVKRRKVRILNSELSIQAQRPSPYPPCLQDLVLANLDPGKCTLHPPRLQMACFLLDPGRTSRKHMVGKSPAQRRIWYIRPSLVCCGCKDFVNVESTAWVKLVSFLHISRTLLQT